MPSAPYRPRRGLLYAALASFLVAAALSVWIVGPRLASPPRVITLATGLEGGDYAELGPRYEKILARSGITVRLLPTGGDVDNLALLHDPNSGVSAAFVLSGIVTDAQKHGLASLGTLMYSPLWLFERGEHRTTTAGMLLGQRVSIGTEGGGTHFLALKLMALDGIDSAKLQLQALTPAQAEKAIDADELDALVLVASWESPVVRHLIADPKVSLMSFPRADAYVARAPSLTKLIVPEGVGDLAKNLPPMNVTLIAAQASLVIREDLSPALQYLLLEAASEIHAGPSLFHRAGHFPAGEAMDIPLSRSARNFYKSGPPFLYQHFPFWLAVLLERLLVFFIPLIPLLGLLYPVARILPGAYYGFMQRKLLLLYRELKHLEAELDSRTALESPESLARRLDDLEARARQQRVPLALSQNLYHLKAHIRLVQGRLAERISGRATASS